MEHEELIRILKEAWKNIEESMVSPAPIEGPFMVEEKPEDDKKEEDEKKKEEEAAAAAPVSSASESFILFFIHLFNGWRMLMGNAV